MGFGITPATYPLSTNTGLVPTAYSETPRAESVADAPDENGDVAARTYYGGSATIKDCSITLVLKSGTAPSSITLGADTAQGTSRWITNVELTTDIIVGFPGETEEDFESTCELVRSVGYANAYTFAYSPREGTVAAAREDQIPEEVKKERLNRLNAVLASTFPANNEKYIGFEGDILVEGVDHRGEPLLFGKLSNFKMVYVEGDESLIGSFVPVKVDGLRFNSLYGHIVKTEA